MKKIKLFSILALTFASFIFYNCSNDSTVDNNENSKITTNQEDTSMLRGSGILIVESDETPEYSIETLELLGFTNFVVDSNKDCIINLETNTVSLPYDAIESSYEEPTNRLSMVDASGWIIAKKNVKPGSGCSSCVDCIGFRCGSTKKVTEISAADWAARIESSEVSNSRNQDAYITVDEENHTINLIFYNDIEWNNLR